MRNGRCHLQAMPIHRKMRLGYGRQVPMVNVRANSPKTHAPTPRGRLEGLTSLRGFAALFVVIHHVAEINPLPQTARVATMIFSFSSGSRCSS
jgi:hypothetical protein